MPAEWRYRLGVRTEDSQSSNPGSIPGSATTDRSLSHENRDRTPSPMGVPSLAIRTGGLLTLTSRYPIIAASPRLVSWKTRKVRPVYVGIEPIFSLEEFRLYAIRN